MSETLVTMKAKVEAARIKVEATQQQLNADRAEYKKLQLKLRLLKVENRIGNMVEVLSYVPTVGGKEVKIVSKRGSTVTIEHDGTRYRIDQQHLDLETTEERDARNRRLEASVNASLGRMFK